MQSCVIDVYNQNGRTEEALRKAFAICTSSLGDKAKGTNVTRADGTKVDKSEVDGEYESILKKHRESGSLAAKLEEFGSADVVVIGGVPGIGILRGTVVGFNDEGDSLCLKPIGPRVSSDQTELVPVEWLSNKTMCSEDTRKVFSCFERVRSFEEDLRYTVSRLRCGSTLVMAETINDGIWKRLNDVGVGKHIENQKFDFHNYIIRSAYQAGFRGADLDDAVMDLITRMFWEKNWMSKIDTKRPIIPFFKTALKGEVTNLVRKNVRRKRRDPTVVSPQPDAEGDLDFSQIEDFRDLGEEKDPEAREFVDKLRLYVSRNAGQLKEKLLYVFDRLLGGGRPSDIANELDVSNASVSNYRGELQELFCDFLYVQGLGDSQMCR